MGLKTGVTIFIYNSVTIKGVFSYEINQDLSNVWLKKGSDYIRGDYKGGQLYTYECNLSSFRPNGERNLKVITNFLAHSYIAS